MALSGCTSVGYYFDLAKGQLQLLSNRQSIDKVIGAAETPDDLRQRLKLVQQARAFAVSNLALPDNKSYRYYVDTGRNYVVWNVFAAPEFSLEPHNWCYLLVGCLSYRGYFDQTKANNYANELSANGLDTYVGGVSAYSTLGWFADPLLNTMMRWDDENLIGTLFHELAHQIIYVDSDTAFNESFASFVEQEGLRQWLNSRGQTPPDFTVAGQREQAFSNLVNETRDKLSALYAEKTDAESMRSRKAAIFDDMRVQYSELKHRQWDGYSGYDAWVFSELNNAKLAPQNLYSQWVESFAALYSQNAGDWSQFYQAVIQLAAKPAEERTSVLNMLKQTQAQE